MKILVFHILLALTLLVSCTENDKRGSKKKIFQARVIKVHDGDTITVSNKHRQIKIRLAWIDCPEYRQAYGLKARVFTNKLGYRKIATIKTIAKDRYGRLVAFVILPDKRVLNEELLIAGLAWNYKRYSKSKRYADLERQARKAKKGLWKQANPLSPSDYRRSKGH